MSVQSEFSRRWQKVRRVTGRIPLRIKLISAVLALVLVALGAISVGGIAPGPAQDGPDPRDDLLQAERFGHVVVAA